MLAATHSSSGLVKAMSPAIRASPAKLMSSPFDGMISLNMVHIAPLEGGTRASCRRETPSEAGRGRTQLDGSVNLGTPRRQE